MAQTAAAHRATSSSEDALLSLDEALARILAQVEPLAAEAVPLGEAAGRTLARPLVAVRPLPPWDNSAMDGFAVRAADVAAATAQDPAMLRVVGEAAAGHAPTASVSAGTAVRVLTGGVLPEGADAVVPVELTDAQTGSEALPAQVMVHGPVRVGDHVRRAGSDVAGDEELLPAGIRLTPAAVGLAAGVGYAWVEVYRRPRVAVITTGDELVPPGTLPGPAQINDANGPMLAAQASAAGAEVVTLPAARDDLHAVLRLLRDACGWADVVVVSGGVSVGAHDVVKQAFERVGRLQLWRVAVQPGKPLAFGRARVYGATDEEQAARQHAGISFRAHERLTAFLFGLPGNPVSSFVTFELFVRPVIRGLAGDRDPAARRAVRAVLAEDVTKARGRRAFLRVRLDRASDSGRAVAHLAGGQGSHVLSALALADGLAVIPEDVDGLSAGADVEVWELDG